MEITEVRIKLMENNNEKLLAFCSVVFDDAFIIHDFKIIGGNKGLFVSMPSVKLTDCCPMCGTKNHLRAHFCNQCGVRLGDNRAMLDQRGRPNLHTDFAHPLHSDFREFIQRIILEDYHKELELARQPGYVSRYDNFGEDRILTRTK